MNVIPETNLMNVIPEARHAQSIGYLLCYHYHLVGTSAEVPENIIRPVVSASKLTWSIRYIHYWNLQFLNNVIINQYKVLLPQA